MPKPKGKNDSFLFLFVYFVLPRNCNSQQVIRIINLIHIFAEGKGGKNRRRGKGDVEENKRELEFKEDGTSREYKTVTHTRSCIFTSIENFKLLTRKLRNNYIIIIYFLYENSFDQI